MQHHPAAPIGPGVSPRVRVAALGLLAAYLLFVTWLALRPLNVMWVSPANVEPFATIRADFARGPAEAARTIGAGMLRMAPLGVLLPLLGRRLGGARFASLCRTVFAGGMISLALEFCQSLVPSRVADVDSIILNTLGVAVAHQLAYGRLRALVLRGPRPSPRPSVRRLAPRHGHTRGAAPGGGPMRQARRTRTWVPPIRADEAPALSGRG
ncbi:VanZ family protein [Streptomyces litchfieldiae]|uniref:VanZ family protein n=1 Tax=Streptomyces litchfieldiae TaxID=3075543 RepID=A0ABU2N0C0_9ACTN|nr:VanZ family protein [Streptomyces sp. DSM 44938]MDT0347215.1 VanZ family protein [Streptomyces sp. DSM 44938]